MTPFLVAVMGVSAPTAVGTDMVFATLTKLTGSFQHYRQRSVNLEVAIFLGCGSIPAGLLGVGTLEWIKGTFDPESVQSIMITVIACTLGPKWSTVAATIFSQAAVLDGRWLVVPAAFAQGAE